VGDGLWLANMDRQRGGSFRTKIEAGGKMKCVVALVGDDSGPGGCRAKQNRGL